MSMSSQDKSLAITKRSARWDKPFADNMSDELVNRVLKVPPFSEMNPHDFPRSLSLRQIIQNDTRLVQPVQNEIVIREGDYGNSAFMVLSGNLLVALEKLNLELIGRESPQPQGWRGLVASLLGPSSAPTSTQSKSASAGIFLQDVPATLCSKRTAEIGSGEIFGELSAMTRSPRTATVVAAQESVLLEIRWQGLRDLMKYSTSLREHIETMYRKNSLRTHLRETPIFQSVSEEQLATLSEQITFESYGDYDWQEQPAGSNATDQYDLALREPTVVEAGQPVDALLMVRSGFARVWKSHGEGRLTLSYLGKGSVIGAEELTLATLYDEQPVWKRSVSAVGYLDVLQLPAQQFTKEILPSLPSDLVKSWASRETQDEATIAPGADAARRHDFLVDRRLVNGPQAMVIDLDRCTRCDDCVRACASTHEGIPRFTREGPIHDAKQFTQACMHCLDPVCMIGCPTGAIHREESTGSVRINDSTCIGCSTCANSCPYSNIQMIELRDQEGAILFDQETKQPVLRASKCDMCFDRAAGPACQEACPHDALVRIDLTNPQPLSDWSARK